MVGVRSPAALELVRQLAFHGLAVEGADFLHFPPGRFSCRLRAYHRLPSPRWHATRFESAWNRLLEQPYAAVFACNEEIFWLSRQALQPPLAAWHGPFGLERLHRKDEFVRLLQEAGLPSPASWPLEEFEQSEHPVILKRVYSRFGLTTQFEPDLQQRPQQGWLVQERLSGEEVCFTGFGWRGRLITSCCYRSRWGDLGQHRGAGLHFQSLHRPELQEQAAALVQFLNYSGPLGLDFVGGTAVECNPRWTSGIHLLDLSPVFQELGLPVRPGWPIRGRAQLAAPMLLRAEANREFWSDWWSAPDAVWSWRDPLPALAQPLTLLETIWRAKRRGISIRQALTWDIEWNGSEHVAQM